MLKHFAFCLLLISACNTNKNSDKLSHLSLIDSVKSADLSLVILTDSFKVVSKDSIYTIKRHQTLGCIDSNYQRLYIHFYSVKKDPKNPLQYLCSGATRVHTTICHFKGILSIDKATTAPNSINDSNYHFATIVFKVKLMEDSAEFESGVFLGQLTSNCYFDRSFKPFYNGFAYHSDNFSNNLFTGQWQNYETGETKICRWGDYRIPNTDDLDVGADNFSVNDRYVKHGWQDYMDAWGTHGDSTRTDKARANESLQWWKQ